MDRVSIFVLLKYESWKKKETEKIQFQETSIRKKKRLLVKIKLQKLYSENVSKKIPYAV